MLCDTEEKYSAAFKSAIGVLTGDSASPGLWNIFFADLFFPSDPDDVVLDGIPVSHACRTSRQCCPLLNLRGRCPTSCGCLLRVVPHQFHGVSVLKTQWMLFGPLPNIVPLDVLIDFVPEYKYVGVWFASTTRRNFSRALASNLRDGWATGCTFCATAGYVRGLSLTSPGR
jgi:hypothetical protein